MEALKAARLQAVRLQPSSDYHGQGQELLGSITFASRMTAEYCPRLGQGTKKDISAEEFSRIYSQDAFYRWLGLDSQEVYVAHRVAGGITSLYRQIGIGCERLVCRIFQDALGLSQADLKWSYEIDEGNRQRTIYLDAWMLASQCAA